MPVLAGVSAGQGAQLGTWESRRSHLQNDKQIPGLDHHWPLTAASLFPLKSEIIASGEENEYF